jgi:hypothetical protein
MKTVSVTLSAFQRQQEKSASVGMKKSCPTCLPITSRATPAVIGDRQVKIRRLLVLTLAIFQRKVNWEACSGGCLRTSKDHSPQQGLGEATMIFKTLKGHYLELS